MWKRKRPFGPSRGVAPAPTHQTVGSRVRHETMQDVGGGAWKAEKEGPCRMCRSEWSGARVERDRVRE
ncbi:hypothetical protein chiPu_0003037 [Chiloscyllium punctatum]|uniref:Uncharacterized protein n=1 Tax=Chiloscyllium punctatum TaxID=137246 RepID=A0A401S2I7_CHIPU|nr:hypothetical protein [Chiloscyllium punctatum]